MNLDGIHSLSALAALDPGGHAAEVAASTPAAVTIAEIEARDAYLTGALGRIDDVVSRFMKVRLDHVLASDSSIGAPTRKVFAQTVASYATNLGGLAERVRDLATRGRSPDSEGIATAVVEAARATLADRDALRAGVLAHISALATIGVVQADHQARDATIGESTRRRWSALRRDFEVLVEQPEKIQAAPFAARVASWPVEQLDEPPAKPEVHPSDLIELD